jgi:4'-phosphopantetheinyl transferase
MTVYWLEQVKTDVPESNDWLSPGEAVRLESMHIAKRRKDWRLGRWTAKCAVAAYLKLPQNPRQLAEIEIRAAASGAPEVFAMDEPVPVTISISHRSGVAACAVAPPGVLLGCDLEVVESRSDGFVADYFTDEEQSLVSRVPEPDRSRLVALLWSGKESALKALSEGLRLDTCCLTVCPVDEPRHVDRRGEIGENSLLAGGEPNRLKKWRPLYVSQTNGEIFQGWWRQTGELLRTMVAVPSPTPPILLKLAEPFSQSIFQVA